MLLYKDFNVIMLINTLLIFSAYLLGSLSAAILVCKILGLSDPRAGGSGNPGTTKVMRLTYSLELIECVLTNHLDGLLSLCPVR